MCGVRLDRGSEILQEYRLKYDGAFKGWNLLEIDAIWAWSGHTTPLDPMAGFEKIIRHKPQLDNPDRCKDNPRKLEPDNLNNLYGFSVEMGRPVAGALPSLPIM